METNFVIHKMFEKDKFTIISNPDYIAPFFLANDISSYLNKYNKTIDLYSYLNNIVSLDFSLEYIFDKNNLYPETILKIFDKSVVQQSLDLDDYNPGFDDIDGLYVKSLGMWDYIVHALLRDMNLLDINKQVELNILSTDFVLQLMKRIGLPDKARNNFKKWIYISVMPIMVSEI